jgi:coenzyme PQQ precursor peptide PqqA
LSDDAALIYVTRLTGGTGLKTGGSGELKKETTMAWTTPTLVEICIGLEINGYLPAEF